MTPANPQLTTASRPRVGIPWRTSAEEDKATNGGPRGKIDDYLKAVERAGGEGVLISLKDKEVRNRLIPTLDAFVLPGSPNDVDPREYGSENHGLCASVDAAREETDRGVLDHAFAEKKPVLAICYGFQMLNVYKAGSLIQDIRTEFKDKIENLERHRKQDPPISDKDPEHYAILHPGSRLAKLAGGTKTLVNSSHHQAIERTGDYLKITAQAEDGIIEGFEWTGDSNWVVGVQWHPERMLGDTLSERLFRDFVAAARSTRDAVAHEA